LGVDGGGTGGTGGSGAGGSGATDGVSCPPGGGACTVTGGFSTVANRDVDILFMIDNSLSMVPLQAKLAANFPSFMTVLTGLPGGLPNVHIAVVSSDMGAGRQVDVQHCALGGDHGLFQAAPRGTCTATGLNANQNFIINVAGQANYTGTIESVFSCIAQLGDQGCGFEHQLASVARALGADNIQSGGPQLPAENAGFLRPNAFLSIILITNEDDCSAPPDSGMFDTGSRYISDPLGPLTSYRCNDFGHLCGLPRARPPRDQDITEPAQGQPGACVPAETNGQLIPVQTIVDQIKGLKRDLGKILVAAVAGPPDPYHVILAPSQQGDPAPTWPQIDHSCVQSSGEFGDPGIRIKAFVDAFGSHGLFLPICGASFAPALQLIAQEIGKVLGPLCVAGRIVDTDGDSSNGVQPSCTVVSHTFDAQGRVVDAPVRACADAPTAPLCWTLSAHPTCTPDSAFQVTFTDPTVVQSNVNFTFNCLVCPQGPSSDPRCQ
jgi:hypothetical protein